VLLESKEKEENDIKKNNLEDEYKYDLNMDIEQEKVNDDYVFPLKDLIPPCK